MNRSMTDPELSPRILRKRLVLVGNALPEKNFSESIDTADIVLRFNFCNHFESGRVGHKTDILCLVNTEERFRSSGELPTRVLDSATEIWLIARAPPDHGDLILKANNIDKGLTRIYTNELTTLREKLGTAAQTQKLSSGIVALERVLTDPRFRLYEKQLVGFTWEGWQGHAWSAEQELCESYRKSGFLEILR
jgi:hypothetical protein